MNSTWCAVVAACLAGMGCGSSGPAGGTGGGGGGDGTVTAGSEKPVPASDHPRIYLPDHRDRLVAELNSGRPAATKFKDSVDRWIKGDDIYGFEAWNAALIGQLTGDAKYCTAAVKAIDAQVSDAQSAISKGDAPAVADDSYLDIGPLIGDLALVYDWCQAALTDTERSAWISYADQAVFNVWNYQDAAWNGKKIDWSGWAIDDPSDNYYYSFLRATMLLGVAAHGEGTKADAWMPEFRQTKIGDELVPTFNTDLTGGGSREGTGYGVSMRVLFHLYDLWAGSTGETISTLTGHTRASMLSFIHQTVPSLDRIAPTGDQSRDSTASFFDYHRDYLQQLIGLFPDDPLAAPARSLLAASSVPEMANQFMYVYDFLYDDPAAKAVMDPAVALGGLDTAYYAPGIGELYARSGWDRHATWVNLIAGPFTQSHAHQDQGSLLIYKDGWLAYDAVIDSKSGLPQQTEAHSVVRIVDGSGKTVEQSRDTASTMLALRRGDGFIHAAADITPVYQGSKLVQKVQREIVYLPPDAIVVYDRVQTSAGSQVWQLVTPAAPAITATHATLAHTDDTLKIAHNLQVERLSPASATGASYDMTKDSDFTAGHRLDEAVAAGDNRFLHVIWIDGAASAVTATGSDGVTLTLAGGTTAVVQFNHDGVGGTLTLGSQTTTLDATIETLPEMQ